MYSCVPYSFSIHLLDVVPSPSRPSTVNYLAFIFQYFLGYLEMFVRINDKHNPTITKFNMFFLEQLR